MDQPETNEVVVAEPAKPNAVAAASAAVSAGNSAPAPIRPREASLALMPSRSGLGALPAQAGAAPCPQEILAVAIRLQPPQPKGDAR
jgi:hypothetical protein